MCSDVKKYDIAEEDCLGIFRVRVRKVEFLIIEFRTVKIARDLARRLDAYYLGNWVFDEVRGEPVLDSWIVNVLKAVPGRDVPREK